MKRVYMAERVGFEPTVEFPQHSLSRRALSTAQTPLLDKSNKRAIPSQPSGERGVFSALLHFKRNVGQLFIALHLQHSCATWRDSIQSCAQAVQRHHGRTIYGVNHVSSLQIRLDPGKVR